MHKTPQQCVVLAGGLGTRLASVNAHAPKSLALINGAPFLHYLFTYLKKQGIVELVLSVGHKYEMIEEYCYEWQDQFDIKLAIEKEPLGTGGGIKNALKACTQKEVFVVNGDTFFDIDLGLMATQFYKAPQADIALALKPLTHFDRYGTVSIGSDNQILAFQEKKPIEVGNINGGIYMLRTNIFNEYIFPEKFSFESDFLNTHYNLLYMYGFVFHNYFIDIGIPSDYNQAQQDFKNLFA